MSTLAGEDAAEVLRRILTERRTVHDFRPEPVPEAIVERALEAARWAPNHHLTEPWRVYLLGPQAQRRIAELNAELVRESRGERAAEIKRERWLAMPGWLLLTSPRSDGAERELEDYAACCCWAQNLMLSLWADGVGAKWTTGAVTATARFATVVGFDRSAERVVGLFWYGYPATIGSQRRQPPQAFVTHVD